MIPLIAALCADLDGGLPTGFARANPRAGDLGSGYAPCPRHELAGAVPALATIDSEDFYGLLGAAASLEGSYAPQGPVTVFGGVELVRYDTLISAFSDSAIGPGHTWAGASVRVVNDERAAAAVDGRVVLPTAFALYRHAHPVAFDLGVSGLTGGEHLRGHGRAGLLHSFAISRGPIDPWLGASLRLGGEVRPGDHFALVVDLDGTLGYDGSKLAVVPELRFAAGRKLGIALGGWVPLVSAIRSPLGVELRLSGRLAE